MNVSRLLIATACSMAVAGAAGVAFAQTTTPSTTNSSAPSQYPSQGQNSSQAQGQAPATAARDGTAPDSMNSTNQRLSDATTPGANTTGTYGTTGATGTAATRSNDGTLRTPVDRATISTERAARADRN